MLDAHCHLNFLPAAGLANFKGSIGRAGEEHAVQFMSCTIDMDDYILAQVRLLNTPGVFIGAGLHPWWVANDQFEAKYQAQTVASMLSVADFVGEVGLDFSPKHAETKEFQIAALKTIFESCAALQNKVISIHCVQATEDLLTLLQETNVLDNNTAILHWYSGSSEHLYAAIDAGCYFSINPRMLETKKGKEYIKVIPSNRLLLETDLPNEKGIEIQWADFKVELTQLAQGIAEQRSTTVDALLLQIELNNHYIMQKLSAAE